MMAQTFCDWINNSLLVSSHLPPFFPMEISLRTAVRWLHHLGFKPVSHKKRSMATSEKTSCDIEKVALNTARPPQFSLAAPTLQRLTPPLLPHPPEYAWRKIRRRKSLSSSSTMNQSSTPTRGKLGCGGRVNGQPFSPRPRAAELWLVILSKSMVGT